MAIKKTIKFTTGNMTLPPTSSSHETLPPTYSAVHPPLGEQPEGNMDALEKLEEAKDRLFKNIDELQENIKKLTEENKRLKTALGLVVNYDNLKEPLVLTEDMEVKDGH